MSQATQSSSTEFGPLTIAYDERVLSPRGWTRLQAEWGADLLADLPPGPVLELCSGAGHIGLLAVHGRDRDLVAVDANPAACAWIRHNADSNQIPVEIREGQLDAVLAPEERFPLIIADPPWVPHAEIGRFREDPPSAIDGGADGLDLARRCIEVIAAHLAPGGSALLQLGNEQQVEQLAAAISSAGLAAVEQRVQPERGVVVRLAGESSS